MKGCAVVGSGDGYSIETELIRHHEYDVRELGGGGGSVHRHQEPKILHGRGQLAFRVLRVGLPVPYPIETKIACRRCRQQETGGASNPLNLPDF